MNFIKSNIIFTIVMSLTLLGALYLIYLDISKHSAITEANHVTSQSNQEFDSALRKGANRPVDLNVKMINEDTEILKVKAKELQRIFGNTFRNPMLKFAASVGETEDNLRKMLRELYEDEKNKVKTSQVLIPLLLDNVAKNKKLSRDRVNELFKNNFINEAQKRTIEDLDFVNGHETLGLALGMSRQMVPTIAGVHLRLMQGKMLRQYLIPGVKTLEGVQNYTYNQFVQRPPSGADVEDILEMLPIYEDIFRFRMKAAGLTDVISFKREGFPTVVSDVYREVKFEATVRGSIDSVRKFAHLLQNAYRDNHVYALTWVSITGDDSVREVQELRSKLADTEKNQQNVLADRTKRRKRSPRSTRKRNTAMLRKLDPSNKEYGKALIGVGKSVTASVKFSYFIYVGEKITRNKS